MPPERPATLHTVVIWPFIEAMTKLGVALPDWGQPTQIQNTTNARVSHEEADALLKWAIELTGRNDLGVLAAEAVEPGHFELVELAARTQGTVGQALGTITSLVAILHDTLLVKLTRGKDSSRVTIAFDRGLKVQPAGYDFIAASLLIAGRRQTRNHDMQPTLLRLPYPKPEGIHPLSRLISSELAFDAPALTFEFPTAVLDIPLARANASMGQALHEAARELLETESSQSKLANRVREHVRQGLTRGEVDAAVIARKLHMSERTLRRKLDAEGIGLRVLVDEVRRDLAMEKLKDASLSTDEVATQLGFTTAQAFHRAFRRWTGGTIQAFRARGRA